MADGGGKKKRKLVDLTLDDDEALVVDKLRVVEKDNQPKEQKRLLLDLTADDDVLPPRRESNNNNDDNDVPLEEQNVAKSPASPDIDDIIKLIRAIDDEFNEEYEEQENVADGEPVRQLVNDAKPKEQKRPVLDLTADSDDDAFSPQQPRRESNNDDDNDVPLEDSVEEQNEKKENAANNQPVRQVVNDNQPNEKKQTASSSEIVLDDLIRDFGRLFSAERQKEIAMAIFLNENITRREIDVLRTENVVNSVVDYIPLTTDFEGVDTQGADPRRAPWEGNEAADYRFAAEFTSRSVRRLAVVYARVGAKPLSYVPNRPWSIIMGRDVGFNIAYLQPNSRIYRSAWLEEWDKSYF
jgi:hypothetical protein